MSLRHLETEARGLLAPAMFELISDVAGEGLSVRRNEEAFRNRSLVPNVLRDVSHVDTTSMVLGRKVAAPIGIPPLPRMGGVHPDGEHGLADAAAELRVLFCAATNSTVALERLVVDDSPAWFQLYPHSDTGITTDLVERAVAAGYDAVAITLDRPVPGIKGSEASKSTDVASYPNLASYGEAGVVAGRYHSAFTWDDLAQLRKATPVPIVLKGILDVEDARKAVDHGCEGIWVSNHGGRQLDQTIATLDVLEEIAAAVEGRGEIFLDGGVRSGIDALIAVALGANCVFFGRPMAYALAVGGRNGVRDALVRVTDELAHAMALMGTAQLDDISHERVR